MRPFARHAVLTALLVGLFTLVSRSGWAQVEAEQDAPLQIDRGVKAWEGTITIPTYPWEEDVNPKFWALEGGPKLSTTVKGAIVYPYTMQDHLSRSKVDRTYKALFLENEYLKVTCLPELGGRLHSVLDKTTGEEMFHLNRVIKPGMIAMRGAWISGGVEWNSGPHGHTVTVVSPVDALVRQKDHEVFLEISNVDKIFRTRWTVRVTLHSGKAYLEEQIGIYNPTDGMHPYYFWNCTAFPNRPGTRFIYPMTVGMDHSGEKFFSWPVHEGKDLSWLKNHETWASVFAYKCDFDFFGAYDVDADRGIVQVADHRMLPGKKAWTWGNWEFGQVAQQNLTDEDGPYIEVQSGPLPTQSDYGILRPRQLVGWEEYWYPVHGLGDGFEYATKDLAIQTSRDDGKLELRLLATSKFPGAVCQVSRSGRELVRKRVSLSPEQVQVVTVARAGSSPVKVVVNDEDGEKLASFTTPLPIPEVSPPDPSTFEQRPDHELTVEEKYFRGRKHDRDTNRLQARRYYELALAEDPGHVASLRALAVLDLEAALYEEALARLTKSLDRDPDDGLCWYFLGVCHLKLGNEEEALRCACQTLKRPETRSIGCDLAGRAYSRSGELAKALHFFRGARIADFVDQRAEEHALLAQYAFVRTGGRFFGERLTGPPRESASRAIDAFPTRLVCRAFRGVLSEAEMNEFVRQSQSFVGEYDFQMIDTSLVFAELGLYEEAGRLLRAACVDSVARDRRDPLVLYYLAYYTSQSGEEEEAAGYLREAARSYRDFVFASRPEGVPVLRFAVQKNPNDAHAHFQLGNLYANLGRVDEAVPHWEKAAALDPKLSVAWRNLGLIAAALENDLNKAAANYRMAIVARPSDQTLYRDLAEILIADEKRPEAIEILETMPVEGMRRADCTIMLAQAYLDEKRYDQTIALLESTPYFVNWEGQDVTWVVFNRAHVARGRNRLEGGDAKGALGDFEAALTYPENLGVGRSNQPQEAAAQYWRGKALEALGRLDQARAPWKEGAAGAPGSDEQNQHRKLCREALTRLESQ